MVFHNTLVASDYGLLDENTFEPKPSYWGALLWRRLMGTTVLDAGFANRAGLHVYAQCLRGVPGGVGMLVLNTDRQKAFADPAWHRKPLHLGGGKLDRQDRHAQWHPVATGCQRCHPRDGRLGDRWRRARIRARNHHVFERTIGQESSLPVSARAVVWWWKPLTARRNGAGIGWPQTGNAIMHRGGTGQQEVRQRYAVQQPLCRRCAPVRNLMSAPPHRRT